MICYKCDMCGDLHYHIGEMNNIKISYAGKAHCSYPNNGEFMVCDKCKVKLIKMLSKSSNDRNAAADQDEEKESDTIDVSQLKEAISGDCFHGEVWVKCPHCNSGVELVGITTECTKDGYDIVKCPTCKKLFKV